MVLRNGVPPELRGQLERVQEELERLTRMCGRLLLLARIDHDAGDRELFGEEVDLAQVVEELVEQMTPLAQERGVRVVCATLAPVQVRGSKQLLVEALLNLLHNALRFAGLGGRVEVAVRDGGERVTVSVADSGPGVADEARERIFRPFYSTATTAGETDGVGLGLAIVRAIARAHGGTVGLVSAAGSGSCFRLVLPAIGAGETPHASAGKSRPALTDV
jgi:signal transduction histidine kinase